MKTQTRRGWLVGLTGIAAALGLAMVSPAVVAGDKEKHAHAHVGEAAPTFTLTDATGKEVSLKTFTDSGKIVVLEWFNPGCPFVVRHHEKYTTMKDTAAKHGDKIQWIAINSGGKGKEGHGGDKAAIEKWKLSYPVLIDEDGKVGKMYGAQTTPHMFVIDAKGVLQYAGAIDNDRQDQMEKGKKINYVDQAITELLAGTPVSTKETKAYGCSVKYAN